MRLTCLVDRIPHWSDDGRTLVWVLWPTLLPESVTIRSPRCPTNHLQGSGAFSMIEAEHSTESLSAPYSTSAIDRGITTLRQPILQYLTITLFVVMRERGR